MTRRCGWWPEDHPLADMSAEGDDTTFYMLIPANSPNGVSLQGDNPPTELDIIYLPWCFQTAKEAISFQVNSKNSQWEELSPEEQQRMRTEHLWLTDEMVYYGGGDLIVEFTNGGRSPDRPAGSGHKAKVSRIVGIIPRGTYKTVDAALEALQVQ